MPKYVMAGLIKVRRNGRPKLVRPQLDMPIREANRIAEDPSLIAIPRKPNMPWQVEDRVTWISEEAAAQRLIEQKLAQAKQEEAA
jgi:hypothetical protein